mmetsp:Transcript_13275/g.29529  ORF Transcript_13275/g.29529 Transcript_13275/m.29529 type:complete len:457 (+) Transcript_13275:327-1697(+)
MRWAKSTTVPAFRRRSSSRKINCSNNIVSLGEISSTYTICSPLAPRTLRPTLGTSSFAASCGAMRLGICPMNCRNHASEKPMDGKPCKICLAGARPGVASPAERTFSRSLSLTASSTPSAPSTRACFPCGAASSVPTARLPVVIPSRFLGSSGCWPSCFLGSTGLASGCRCLGSDGFASDCLGAEGADALYSLCFLSRPFLNCVSNSMASCRCPAACIWIAFLISGTFMISWSSFGVGFLRSMIFVKIVNLRSTSSRGSIFWLLADAASAGAGASALAGGGAFMGGVGCTGCAAATAAGNPGTCGIDATEAAGGALARLATGGAAGTTGTAGTGAGCELAAGGVCTCICAGAGVIPDQFDAGTLSEGGCPALTGIAPRTVGCTTGWGEVSGATPTDGGCFGDCKMASSLSRIGSGSSSCFRQEIFTIFCNQSTIAVSAFKHTPPMISGILRAKWFL